jgi:hypothetical protein
MPEAVIVSKAKVLQNLSALSPTYPGILTKIPALGIAAREPLVCLTRSAA